MGAIRHPGRDPIEVILRHPSESRGLVEERQRRTSSANSRWGPGFGRGDEWPHPFFSFFLYMASIRAVTAKPPKMLMLASTTPARPSHLAPGTPAAAAAIRAPTMITEEMALVTDMSGVWSAGVTDQTT